MNLQSFKVGVRLIFIFLILWTILAMYFDESSLDTCSTDRKLHLQSGFFRQTTRMLFYFTVSMLVFFIMQILSWAPFTTVMLKKSLQINYSSFTIAFTILWYCMTYTICFIVKHILDDQNCSSHPNSVSGHYTFHIYYLLSLPYLYMTLAEYQISTSKVINSKNKRDDNSLVQVFRNGPSVHTLAMTYVLFVVSAVLTLTRTWTFGFHSLRQILYGTLLALISHITCISLLEQVSRTQKHGPLVGTIILTSGLVVSGLFVLLLFESVPFEIYELATITALWLVVILYSWKEYSRKLKAE